MEIFPSQKKPPLACDVGVSSLSLYRSPPEFEVRLEDFELFTIDRLRGNCLRSISISLFQIRVSCSRVNLFSVLQGISDGLSCGRKADEMEKLVGITSAAEVADKDIISHFVLRLVYCREEEMRKWFLSMENILIRHRFKMESFEAQRAILAELDRPYKAVSGAEHRVYMVQSVKEKLSQVARPTGQHLTNADVLFYRVPFEEVPELVSGRRVYIHKGHAYAAMNQLASMVVTQFLTLLSKALILTNCRKWTSTIREQEKHRLTPVSITQFAILWKQLAPVIVVLTIQSQSMLQNYRSRKLIEWQTIHFLCAMRHLFGKLREDHHLKYGGRMQLGLFLKGVGINLDDALAFWRAEFPKKGMCLLLVGLERFEKEYAYGIRHNYGKEGKRATVNSEENLRAALDKIGVSSRAMEDVLDRVQNKHYQGLVRAKGIVVEQALVTHCPVNTTKSSLDFYPIANTSRPSMPIKHSARIGPSQGTAAYHRPGPAIIDDHPKLPNADNVSVSLSPISLPSPVWHPLVGSTVAPLNHVRG
ncbi:putative DNA primase large subunit [Drosera capensis]